MEKTLVVLAGISISALWILGAVIHLLTLYFAYLSSFPAVLASLFFPMYYMIASWIVSWQLWRIRRQAAPILSVSPLGAESPQSVLGEKA